MKICEEPKRVLLVAGIFLAVLGWQQFQQARSERATVQWMRSKLEEWNSSSDLNVRNDLHDQMERRMQEIQNPEDLIRAVPPPLLDTFVANEALQKWWDNDRKGVLTWMGTQENPPKYQVARFLREMAENPAEERQYLSTLSASPWKEKVLGALAQDDIVLGNPQAAISLLDQMQPGENRTTLLRSAILEWAQNDFEGSITWIDRISPPELREDLTEQAALGRAVSDPQAAAQWLLQVPETGKTISEGIRAILGRWVEKSTPAPAVAWVEQLPEGRIREGALKGLISAWRQSDPGGVAKWVSGLPNNTLRASASRILNSPEQESR